MASYDLKEINTEAKVQKANQCTSAGIELLSKQIFEGAAPGHILAMETKNSDIDFSSSCSARGREGRTATERGEGGNLRGMGCRIALRAGLCSTESGASVLVEHIYASAQSLAVLSTSLPLPKKARKKPLTDFLFMV
jgi:hypothetical protein